LVKRAAKQILIRQRVGNENRRVGSLRNSAYTEFHMYF
jgi:hypothetical protein